jgi:hypothetical protein
MNGHPAACVQAPLPCTAKGQCAAVGTGRVHDPADAKLVGEVIGEPRAKFTTKGI